MSVSVAKADGVTVFTLTTDPESLCPPMCQILGRLCYNPLCCSVSQRLRSLQGNAQSVLGTLQVMVGVLNIGLGAILCASGGGSSWMMDWTLFPYWLGGLFMFFGFMSILSEKCPSLCLVGLNVFLNAAGVAFAITAIVLYSVNIGEVHPWRDCYWSDYDYRWRYTTMTPEVKEWWKLTCAEMTALYFMLVRGINGLLIVLSVLVLCITISSVVLGIKSLQKMNKKEQKPMDEPELYRPLLEEVSTNP